MRTVRALPDAVRGTGENLPDAESLGRGFIASERAVPASARTDERLASVEGRLTYRLFGVFPLRTVRLLSGEEVRLMPGGTAVGITIHTDGVLVVGLGSVDTSSGPVSPGASAGLAVGDVIESINGEAILSAEQLSSVCQKNRGTMQITVRRKAQSVTLSAMPVRSREGVTQLGVWVRDSTAGVGTISFFDDVTKRFAALGHAVSDVDTQSMLSIREGRILPSQIVDIVPGSEGSPGELTGAFSVSGDALGTIERNTEYGIFGKMTADYENGLCGELPLAEPSEVHVGGAVMLSTISSGGVRSFSCEISRVSAQTEAAPKGMVIEVTDDALVSTAGGIVQGMSGSPVLQDGKLVGIVTHVFVNDPLRGYCVYAKWMFEKMNDGA